MIVDYFVVAHKNIPLCSSCKAETMTELYKGRVKPPITQLSQQHSPSCNLTMPQK